MPKNNTHIRIFRRLSEESKRALFYEDLDIDDIVDEELTNSERSELRRLIRSWGNRQGLE